MKSKSSIGLRVILVLILFYTLIWFTKSAKAEEIVPCNYPGVFEWVKYNLEAMIQKNFKQGDVVSYHLSLPNTSSRPDYQCQMPIQFSHGKEEFGVNLFYTPGSPYVTMVPIKTT